MSARRSTIAGVLAVALIGSLLAMFATAAGGQTPPRPGAQKIEPAILSQPDDKQLVFWLTLRAEADLGAAPSVDDWGERGGFVVDALQGTAERSQKALTGALEARGAEYEPFWISNTIRVTGPKRLAEELAARPDVEQVLADRTIELPEPAPGAGGAPESIGWNVGSIRAPEAWSTFGTRGEGVVVANLDTGVQFDHPAVVAQYRGNTGGVFDHNYNWFDPSQVCGPPSSAPCDNDGHGTHTMGTIVGGDGGAEQIGVAPGARWIAAKGCEYNSCSQSALLASGQWLLAPTDRRGQNPRPDLRPDIVNNSWGSGGNNPWFTDIVSSWVAAGMFPVFANGNNGSGCGTSGSPGDYVNSYSVGAYDAGGVIAAFSSRGAAAGRVKPNIAAPGVNVRSSVPANAYASLNGTSMAAPHVAGVIALMWSAAPSLVGDVAATRALLDETALDTSDLTCGGTPTNNNVWGEGRLDAFAAVELAPRGPSGVLRGAVAVAGPGNPVPGAQVQAIGAITRTTSTDGAGMFSLALPVGTYRVSVTAFGYTPAQAETAVTEGATSVRDLALSPLPSHPVAGTVRSDTGSPIEGVQVALDGTPLPVAVSNGSGLFSFAGVPEGTYRLVASGAMCHDGAAVDLVVDDNETADITLARRLDGFGHSCRSVTPSYIEADAVLALTGDDSVTSVSLPFPFSYYGTSYGTAAVSTNGLLSFVNSSTAYVNHAIPNQVSPNATVYAFWDDLYVDGASSVRTKVVGSEPDRRFVVEWRNVKFFGDETRRVDFEVVLSQDGTVLLQYRNIADDPRERGAEATIGIENAAGTDALAQSYNRPTLPPSSHTVRIDLPTAQANVAPDAVDDAATVPSNQTTVVPVLGNDSDPDGDPVRVTVVSSPARGIAFVSPEGVVTYLSQFSYGGPDSFTYDVSDGRGGTDRATVSVTVEEPPRPVAIDDSATTPEDTATTITVLANDTDPRNRYLNLTEVSDPPNGVVRMNFNTTVTYQPDADFSGVDSFTYVVRNDDGHTDQATVSVTVTPVNDPPVAVDDSSTTPENTPVNVAVLGNDSDVDGDRLAVSAVSDPPNGAATVKADMTVTYLPDPNWSGTDSFTYDLSDGRGGTSRATVNVTVTDVPEPPSPTVATKSPATIWDNRSAPSYDGMGLWLMPVNNPSASAGQSPAAYSYDYAVIFMDGQSHAILSLSIGPEGKRATFTVRMADGTNREVQVPMSWQPGRPYFVYTYHLGGGVWGAWVVDGSTWAATTIGTLAVSPQYTKLSRVSLSYTYWSGAPLGGCAEYPRSQTMVLPPAGFAGGRLLSAGPASPQILGTGCPAVARVQGPWTVYEVGRP